MLITLCVAVLNTVGVIGLKGWAGAAVFNMIYLFHSIALIVTGCKALNVKFTTIGCLLLADHPQDNQFELVYMGIVPQARGQRFGADVTRQALWLTGAAGRRQLVLGVDAENEPALQIYEQLGFTEWDRRRVLLKTVEG